MDCPHQDLTPRSSTHSSWFLEFGYLTESEEFLRKTAIREQTWTELKIPWSLRSVWVRPPPPAPFFSVSCGERPNLRYPPT